MEMKVQVIPVDRMLVSESHTFLLGGTFHFRLSQACWALATQLGTQKRFMMCQGAK
jgi:hypothetical protein